ncbi:hypothetical protein [Aeromonas hydrophila]|uniref:hypothetical protein n=1 Tax=Aeromonas hydrophila TaxID=644 RepID=UPI000332B2AD|nr:hypothetical protein [Aeromonas hydrophila]AGM45022.1 hypothetical protein AHML_16270 [Aeromonas hydrophila ML09-119]AHX33656.1 hypothetical protein V428_16820 [Aeromonas hydrophila subsp. hydrophila AL09-71]AHX70457.1 hypothetical protein V429_16855 [Aeromonas hydrophila pc104A]AJE35562.1 hypothetical protein V469_06440 [Aeromonas hydrophila J-1]AKJ33757.1 hypothetical protein U876_06420 [Aeromonas hydrophila NJ-35]
MWPYRKVVTQSLKTPLVIARVLVYIALLLLLPLPLIIFSGSLVGGAIFVPYAVSVLPVSIGLIIISGFMVILIARVEALKNR